MGCVKRASTVCPPAHHLSSSRAGAGLGTDAVLSFASPGRRNGVVGRRRTFERVDASADEDALRTEEGSNMAEAARDNGRGGRAGSERGLRTRTSEMMANASRKRPAWGVGAGSVGMSDFEEAHGDWYLAIRDAPVLTMKMA